MYSINFFVCLICVVLDKMGEYIDMSNAMLEVRDKCVWHQLLVLYVQFFKISFYGQSSKLRGSSQLSQLLFFLLDT